MLKVIDLDSRNRGSESQPCLFNHGAILGKSLNLSKPQLPYLLKGDDANTYFTGLTEG